MNLIQRIVDNVDAEIQKFLDLQGEEFLSRADEIVERIVGFFSEDIKALIAEEIGPIAVVMGITGGLMWWLF